MPLLEKHLVIKKSKIPGAGNGLFTTIFIPKGTRIIEYKGRITSWRDVLNGKEFNAYVYYVNRNHVIDAMKRKKSLGRYANDATGLTKIDGISNNTRYVVEDNRVFIEAKKDIQAGEEILVSYGREYWQVIKDNQRIEAESKQK
ncbi:MAG TPA: SET domain-containing protein [Hanamia sp.]|jgi:SET domain-containing protein|nr:SET domain-containing protein [Hanamia sp.]